MGIRVHKFLGYGLDDVQYEGTRPEDSRINPDNKLLRDYDENLKVEDYLQWLEARYSEDRLVHGDGEFNLDLAVLKDCKEDRRVSFYQDAFAYQGEYGMPNVLVLKPLCMNDWSRYDNSIDYAVETYLHDYDQTTRVDRMFRNNMYHGQYPWSGVYMNARTGERLPHDAMYWVQAHWPPIQPDEIRLPLAKNLGFNTIAEAEQYIVPVVPIEIRDIAEYTELFTDDTVWRQLRPMLYTYWS